MVYALGVSAALAVAPCAAGSTPKMLTAARGQTIVFAGSRLACFVDDDLDVTCSKIVTVCGNPVQAPGTHEFTLRADGTAVIRAVGRDGKLTFVYTRALASRHATKPLLVLPNQLVRIASTSNVCASGPGHGGLLVECARGVHGAERTKIDHAGRVSIIASRTGAVLWSPQSPSVVVAPGQGLGLAVANGRIVCDVALYQGNTMVDCSHSDTSGAQDGDSFFVFTQGGLIALERQNGDLKPLRAFGPVDKLSKSGETTPTGPPSAITMLGKGSFVRVGTSPLACNVSGKPLLLGCGLTDAKGFGVPNSFFALIRDTGAVEVYRYDVHRKPKLVLRTAGP